MSVNLIQNIINVPSYSRPVKSRGTYGRPKTRNPFPGCSVGSNSRISKLPVFTPPEFQNPPPTRGDKGKGINMYVIGKNSMMSPSSHATPKLDRNSSMEAATCKNQRNRLRPAQHQRFLSISHGNDGKLQAGHAKDHSMTDIGDIASSYKLTFYNPKERKEVGRKKETLCVDCRKDVGSEDLSGTVKLAPIGRLQLCGFATWRNNKKMKEQERTVEGEESAGVLHPRKVQTKETTFKNRQSRTRRRR